MVMMMVMSLGVSVPMFMEFLTTLRLCVFSPQRLLAVPLSLLM